MTLAFSVLTKAQNLNAEKIMGKWKAINVEIPNSIQVPQKEALKFIEDAFLDSKFHFKGNKVFKIEYGKTSDPRIKELFFLDNKNWEINENQIQIGTKNDGFSSMHIIVQEIKGKIYFILPMIRLQMEKLSNDTPSRSEIIKNEVEKSNDINIQLINKKIEKSQIINFSEAQSPPLASKCKSKWDIDKKQKCTKNYINKHVAKNFDTGLLEDSGLTGVMKIIITFIIDINGKPINIKVTGGTESINQNLTEVIGSLPKLKPATKEGKTINTYYEMPLNLRIAE